MNETQFLMLMDQPESVSLDFKRELWHLRSDDGKSKFIKDVVTMANAGRSEPAHILVGVNTGPGGARALVSLAHHADDATLQQIVRGKVDPAPVFLYRELTVRGAVVGVLSVPVSETRPHRITRDYGILRKHCVYIRRGSANEEATESEIEAMYRERFLAQQAPAPDQGRHLPFDLTALLARANDYREPLGALIADCLPVVEYYRMNAWRRWAVVQLEGIRSQGGFALASEIMGVPADDPAADLMLTRRRMVRLDLFIPGIPSELLELPLLLNEPIAELEQYVARVDAAIGRGDVPALRLRVPARVLPGLVEHLRMDPEHQVSLEIPGEAMRATVYGVRHQVIELLIQARKLAAEGEGH